MSTSTRHDFYVLLGVARDCSPEELRAAYRRQARALHPDVSRRADTAERMGLVNEAWRTLSDPTRRQAYDRTLPGRPSPGSTTPPRRTAPPADGERTWAGPGMPRTSKARRQYWVAGLQAQVARLARQAGRSATQTLLLRNARAERAVYDELVDRLVERIAGDTEARLRAARAAGVAPLDLGVGATLVGIRATAAELRRASTLGVGREQLMTAELLDRMWDVVAHELPVSVPASLGGNPHVTKAITGR